MSFARMNSDAHQPSHSRTKKRVYDFRRDPGARLFGTQEVYRPLTFPQAAEHHAQCKVLHYSLVASFRRCIHFSNSTCTPSLGTPIIKAFEALEADLDISAQPLASQNTTAACDRSNPRSLGARRREATTSFFLAYRTRGAKQWWGSPFPLPLVRARCRPRVW